MSMKMRALTKAHTHAQACSGGGTVSLQELQLESEFLDRITTSNPKPLIDVVTQLVFAIFILCLFKCTIRGVMFWLVSFLLVLFLNIIILYYLILKKDHVAT